MGMIVQKELFGEGKHVEFKAEIPKKPKMKLIGPIMRLMKPKMKPIGPIMRLMIQSVQQIGLFM